MEYFLIVAVGFIAQLVDGTLGMAYGVTANSLLLSLGLAPAAASASAHAAELVTTGASAFFHWRADNVDRALVKRLLFAGVLGAALGAYVLTEMPAGRIKPYIAGYLMAMGMLIVVRAFRPPVSRELKAGVGPLGFFGGFFDAIGGGGWGPIVTSTLVARGHEVPRTIGSVNYVEFFVTIAASLVFISNLGIPFWRVVVCIAFGGLLAAPLGPVAAKKLPARPMMIAVGGLIMVLSLRTILQTLH